MSGVEGDDVLTITYGENTTASSRTGTVTLRATGGTGASGSVVLTLTQSGGASHTLGNTPMFTPVLAGSNLTAAGGDISIALTLGGGATGWAATEALDYVSLTPDNGAGVTPVVVTYDANNTFVARNVVVSITTTGPTGVPITENISFTQAGAQGITVVTDPVNLSDLSTAEGAINVDVTLLGSATHWAASEAGSNPLGFLTLVGGTRGIAGDDVLTIRYGENTGVASRNASVTLTATGGTGTAQDTVLMISQLGTGPNVLVSPSTGDFDALPAAGGTIVANVALTGGATGWEAVAESTNPGNFLSVGAKDVTSVTKTQTIAYAVNAGVARTGTVTFTTSGGGAPVPRTVSFTQLGAAPTIDVSTGASDITMVPASPTGGGATGTITATITLGGGAEGWIATKSADLTPVFISDFTSSGDRGNLTLTITYNANLGVSRTATLTLTTTGGTGGPATVDLVLTQLGAAPTIDVSTSLFDITMVPASPAGGTGTITGTITLGGGAEGWTATKSADLAPVFISDFTSSGDRDNLTLTITYNENLGVGRSATLTFTTVGGTGAAVEKVLVFTQLAAAPAISEVAAENMVGASAVSFDPTAEKLAAASTGTILATITLGGGATGWETAKEGDTGDVFLTSFTASGVGATVLEIAYNANGDALERSATIKITPTGAGGATGAVFSLVITQLGTDPTITVGVVTDVDGATITPTGTTYSVPAYGTDADRSYYVDGTGCRCLVYCLGRLFSYECNETGVSFFKV